MCEDRDVERILYIEEMKAELRELSDGEAIIETVDEDLPLAMEEQFLEHVLAFETAETGTHRQVLEAEGVALSPPDELNDDELARKLEELIQALARHRVFLRQTDHLSNRELYAHLLDDILDDEITLLPPESETNCHIDILGGCSEEDIDLWLTYYAGETDREEWAADFPDDGVPPHQDLPYDRDRHLPTPPPPSSPYDDPEVEQAWIAECHGKLLQRLAEDGLVHGAVHDDPISYAPGLACVWSIEGPDGPGTVGWWAINGDLPTTYLPTVDLPDPPSFLRAVGQRWRSIADALGHGRPGIAPEDRRSSGILLWRAGLLERWADDDRVWEAE